MNGSNGSNGYIRKAVCETRYGITTKRLDRHETKLDKIYGYAITAAVTGIGSLVGVIATLLTIISGGTC